WMLGNRLTVSLSGGHGLVTASLYEQDRRYIVHLNSRAALSRVPGRQYDLLPIGPVEVQMRPPAGATAPDIAKLRVAGKAASARMDGGMLAVTVEHVLDHEVVVVDWA